MTVTIDSFQGEYRFLSNFWPCKFVDKDNGTVWRATENWYQAQKLRYLSVPTGDFPVRATLATLQECTPGESKKVARTIPLDVKAWDDAKLYVMVQAIKMKFDPETPTGWDLCQRLIATDPALLVEGNTWNDTYWGVCNGKGQNMLGEILMARRRKIALLCVDGSPAHVAALKREIVGLKATVVDLQAKLTAASWSASHIRQSVAQAVGINYREYQ